MMTMNAIRKFDRSLKEKHCAYYQLMRVGVVCLFLKIASFFITMIGVWLELNPVRVIGIVLAVGSVFTGFVSMILMFPVLVFTFLKNKQR